MRYKVQYIIIQFYIDCGVIFCGNNCKSTPGSTFIISIFKSILGGYKKFLPQSVCTLQWKYILVKFVIKFIITGDFPRVSRNFKPLILKCSGIRQCPGIGFNLIDG